MHRATARSTRHHARHRCHDVDGHPSDACAARYFVIRCIERVERVERFERIWIYRLVLTWLGASVSWEK